MRSCDPSLRSEKIDKKIGGTGHKRGTNARLQKYEEIFGLEDEKKKEKRAHKRDRGGGQGPHLHEQDFGRTTRRRKRKIETKGRNSNSCEDCEILLSRASPVPSVKERKKTDNPNEG